MALFLRPAVAQDVLVDEVADLLVQALLLEVLLVLVDGV